MDPVLFPAVSFLDPEYTFTVSKKQTAAGIADAMNHTIEQYFVEDTTLLNDGFCESMLRSLMQNGRLCLDNPNDYTARAEMMLACTYGCNGILSLGKIYKGADGLGAELGHTKLVYHGERCTCGQLGCLESYCSATALIRHADEKGLKNYDAKMVFDAAASGDETCQNLVNEYISMLAAGISTFITIFRPERIILGGGVANAGAALLDPLNEILPECTFGARQSGIPPVVRATLGNDAGIIGAAFLV